MLILSRVVNEEIWIGDDIRVLVVAIKGTTVRLGIDASRGISVDRSEVRVTKLRKAKGELCGP